MLNRPHYIHICISSVFLFTCVNSISNKNIALYSKARIRRWSQYDIHGQGSIFMEIPEANGKLRYYFLECLLRN